MNKKNSCKVCKSVETKLFLKGKKCFTSSCPIEKKNNKRDRREKNIRINRKTVKPYAAQIIEKRKIIFRYNITFSQLKKYFVISKKKHLNLDNIIESRLDNLVYRSGFAPNIRTARQMVLHGFVNVNEKKCNIGSRLINLNDIIEIKKEDHIFHLSEKPSWVSTEINKVKLLEIPKCEEKFINFSIISEFLSRYV